MTATDKCWDRAVPVFCPKCGSFNTELQSTGRKTGTVVGGVAGAIITAGISGAKTGAVSGAAIASCRPAAPGACRGHTTAT